MNNNNAEWLYTSVILTAMQNELDSVRSLLTDITEDVLGPKSNYFYTQGRFLADPPNEERSSWRILIRMSDRGQAKALQATTVAVHDWEPDVLMFIGCAGGRPDWMHHAQVVVATSVLDCEAGRVERDGLKLAPRPPGSVDPHLLDAARQTIGRKTEDDSGAAWTKRLGYSKYSNRYFSEEIKKNLTAVAEVMASGDKVITSTDHELWKSILVANPLVSGIETEGMGFMSAECCRSDGSAIPRLMIRGISDLLNDKDENDESSCSGRPLWLSGFTGYELQCLASAAATAVALDTLLRFQKTIHRSQTDLGITTTTTPQKVVIRLKDDDLANQNRLTVIRNFVSAFGAETIVIETVSGSLIATLVADIHAIAILRALEKSGMLSRLAETDTTILSAPPVNDSDISDDITMIVKSIGELGAKLTEHRQAAAFALDTLSQDNPTWRPAIELLLRKVDLPVIKIIARNQDDLNDLYVPVQQFYLKCGRGVFDLRPISRFSEMVSLNIENTRVSDLSPIAGNTNLVALNASGSKVHDITPLANLDNLEFLDLSSTKISDISPIHRLSCLKKLSLRMTQVSDVSPISLMEKIEELEISSMNEVDISRILPSANLRYLNLSGKDNYRQMILPGLEEYFYTNREGKAIKNLNALRYLPKLEYLVTQDGKIAYGDRLRQLLEDAHT